MGLASVLRPSQGNTTLPPFFFFVLDKSTLFLMGVSTSRGKKDFQSVVPYSGPDTPVQKKIRFEGNLESVGSSQTSSKPRGVMPLKTQQSWKVDLSKFNFEYTEGQSRRDTIAECEDECSEITSFLFVGGAKVR
jgi:hypothetical protein